MKRSYAAASLLAGIALLAWARPARAAGATREQLDEINQNLLQLAEQLGTADKALLEQHDIHTKQLQIFAQDVRDIMADVPALHDGLDALAQSPPALLGRRIQRRGSYSERWYWDG